jgi:CBS domain-containing protein
LPSPCRRLKSSMTNPATPLAPVFQIRVGEVCLAVTRSRSMALTQINLRQNRGAASEMSWFRRSIPFISAFDLTFDAGQCQVGAGMFDSQQDGGVSRGKVRRTADSTEVSMRVKDVMTKKMISVSPQASVADALNIMTRSRLSGLPVIDERSSLVGVVSEADFLRRAELGTAKPAAHWLESIFLPGRAAEVYARAHAKHVDQIMSTDVATIEENASLGEAVALMEGRRVKRLPVVAGGKVVGMIARADFVHALALFLRQPYEEGLVGDAEIKCRIEEEMQAQFWAPTALLDVVVKSGVVNLHGVLSDERERNALHALVENVEGVRELHDHIVWAGFSGMVTLSPEDAAKGDPA